MSQHKNEQWAKVNVRRRRQDWQTRMLLLVLVSFFVNETTVTRCSYVHKDYLKDCLSVHEQLTVIICNSNDYWLKIRSIMLHFVRIINLPMLENRFRKWLGLHCNENKSVYATCISWKWLYNGKTVSGTCMQHSLKQYKNLLAYEHYFRSWAQKSWSDWLCRWLCPQILCHESSQSS